MGRPNGAPAWLKDGSFLWLSERTGWKHLYHYTADGTLGEQITSGEWEVRTLHGVDEPGGLDLLPRHRAQPHRRRRLSRQARWQRPRRGCRRREGTHVANFSPGVLALRRHLERPRHAAAGAGARGRRRRGARRRREHGRRRSAEFAMVEAGVPAGEDPRRLRDGGDADQAAGFDPAQRYPVYPAHLRRPARAAGAEPLGRRRPACIYQLLAQQRHRRLDLRQPIGQRQGRRVGVDRPTSSSACSELAGHRGRPRLAEASSRGSTARASASTAGATAAS